MGYSILFLLLALLQGISTVSPAAVIEVTFEDELRALEQALRGMASPNACSTARSSPRISFEYDSFEAHRKDFCNPLSVPKLCQKAHSLCRKYGKGCMEHDPSVQLERSRSPNLRRVVLKKTADLFYSKLRDPAFIHSCCGNDSTCEKWMKSVNLVLVKGLAIPLYAAGRYTFYPQTGRLRRVDLVMSESILFSPTHFSQIERELIHEFGHLCQQSRATDRDLRLQNQCPFEEFRLEDSRNYISKDFADCIHPRLKKAAAIYRERNKKDPCIGKWYEEILPVAFQTRYAHDLKSHEFNCFSMVDEHHGPVNLIMECLFQTDPIARENTCGAPRK
ncbi:MAG: hypothetical protein A2428_10715 [Bdellovibrionales bacterium RIFOXYC1_FULL_54_43]|nr:MAG: hypothetical protein A2428_10715 [Bdellovibrionales bacterium RIFOXYC1_FULL_54_43]OFZ85363.1 MAG: hypothetical protein A2603_05490 [Bdellovibrionales bacterium RIFOXYD1_FULL_55_31]